MSAKVALNYRRNEYFDQTQQTWRYKTKKKARCTDVSHVVTCREQCKIVFSFLGNDYSPIESLKIRIRASLIIKVSTKNAGIGGQGFLTPISVA